VLDVRPLPAPRVTLENEPRFHTVVRAAFAQRRKMLANTLAAGLGLSVESVRMAAAAAGIDPGRRAETLDIKEFAELARRL
jgi:16S rRNA (adenine1518-N6/adenine1519-N6)-dimethyltransferase